MKFLVMLCLLIPFFAQSAEMAVSLNNHQINVDLRFNGTNLLIFGALEEPGDLIITVQGPDIKAKIQKKSNNFGVWTSGETLYFNDIAGYYYWATSSDEIYRNLTNESLNRLNIGSLAYITNLQASSEQNVPYQSAYNFARLMAQKQLLNLEPYKITKLGNHLFRLNINLPSEAPVGTYLASVYVVKNNRITAAETTPFFVRKTGFSNQLSDFAYFHSWYYGFFSCFWAILLGFFAYIWYNPSNIGEYKWQILKFFRDLYARIATRLRIF